MTVEVVTKSMEGIADSTKFGIMCAVCPHPSASLGVYKKSDQTQPVVGRLWTKDFDYACTNLNSMLPYRSSGLQPNFNRTKIRCTAIGLSVINEEKDVNLCGRMMYSMLPYGLSDRTVSGIYTDVNVEDELPTSRMWPLEKSNDRDLNSASKFYQPLQVTSGRQKASWGHWIPCNIPVMQSIANPGITTSAHGEDIQQCVWTTPGPKKQPSPPATYNEVSKDLRDKQPCLLFRYMGAEGPSGQTGPTISLTIKWHWEVCPALPFMMYATPIICLSDSRRAEAALRGSVKHIFAGFGTISTKTLMGYAAGVGVATAGPSGIAPSPLESFKNEVTSLANETGGLESELHFKLLRGLDRVKETHAHGATSKEFLDAKGHFHDLLDATHHVQVSKHAQKRSDELRGLDDAAHASMLHVLDGPKTVRNLATKHLDNAKEFSTLDAALPFADGVPRRGSGLEHDEKRLSRDEFSLEHALSGMARNGKSSEVAFAHNISHP